MTTVTLKDSPEVKRIVLAAFPNYRKQRAFVSAFDGEININSYWDGGSKDEYALVHLATGQRKTLPTSTHPFFEIANRGMANQETDDVRTDHVGNVYLKRLPAGFALVAAGTFCGKPATAHVYTSSDNLLKAA